MLPPPDFAFLDAVLGYSADAVTLSLTRNQTGFADIGTSSNQRAAAASLDSLRLGNALFDKVVQLDEQTAPSVFDQLSGEIHASVSAGIIHDSQFLRETMNERIRAAFGGFGQQPPGASHGLDDRFLPASSATADPVFWSGTFGSWGRIDGDDNVAPLHRSIGGMLVGADTIVFDDWRLGLIGGYSRSSLDIPVRASSGSIDTYTAGFYGGNAWRTATSTLLLRAGLAYSFNQIDTSRSINFTGFTDSLSADYGAHTFQTFAEFAYGADLGGIQLEPFANFAYVRLSNRTFFEAGGPAALATEDRSMDTSFTTLGIRAEHQMSLGTTTVDTSGTLGWRHAFGDIIPTITQAFAGSDSFTVTGSPLAKNVLVLDAGFTAQLSPAARLGITYQGEVAGRANDHGVKATLNIRF